MVTDIKNIRNTGVVIVAQTNCCMLGGGGGGAGDWEPGMGSVCV